MLPSFSRCPSCWWKSGIVLCFGCIFKPLLHLPTNLTDSESWQLATFLLCVALSLICVRNIIEPALNISCSLFSSGTQRMWGNSPLMYFGSLAISVSTPCLLFFVCCVFYHPRAVTTWQSSNSNTFTLCPLCQDPHCGLSTWFCWAAGQSGPWSGKREAMNGVSAGRTKPPPSYLTRPRPACSLHCLARQIHMND